MISYQTHMIHHQNALNDRLINAVQQNDSLELLLKKGANPNSRNHLTEANTKAITLLLEYGADPNVLVTITNETKLKPTNLTIISYFFRSSQYPRALALAKFAPCTMNENTIKNTIYSIIDYSLELPSYILPVDFWDREISNLLKNLCTNLPLIARTEVKVNLEKKLGYSSLSYNTQYWPLIKKSILEPYFLAESLIFISLVLKSNKETRGILAEIPFEVLKSVMSYLFLIRDLKVNEYLPPKPDKLWSKINAFKTIYTILSEIDNYGSHNFLTLHENLKALEIIKEIHLKIEQNPGGLTHVSWQLALIHHENFSSANIELIKGLVNWRLATEYKPSLFQTEDYKSALRQRISDRLNTLTTPLIATEIGNFVSFNRKR